MIQIERKGNGFEVSAVESGFGSFSAIAKNAQEAANAVQHYYGGAHSRSPKQTCPFCRESERQMSPATS